MRGLKTIIFLIISNTFMTFAWYGHLKFKDFSWGKNLGLFSIILISWGWHFSSTFSRCPLTKAALKITAAPLAWFSSKPYKKPLP